MRSMVVPWIVVAAPLAAIVLRLTQAAILETIEAEYDIPMLQALALWAAAIIVVVSALADLVLVRLDPRACATGRPVG